MATNLPALPQPTDVDRTPGERILTGIGGVLSAGGGRSNDQSPLIQAVNKVHQRRVDEAQMYRRVYSSYAAQMAMGVDDTGKHFIDPTNGQVLDQDAYDAVSNKMNAAHDAYSKAAGVDKTTKSALDTHRTIVDHLIGLFQKNRESGNGQATAYTPDAAAAATAPAPTSAAPTAGAAGGTGGGATGSPPNVPAAAAAGPSSLPAPPAPPTSPTDLAKPMAGGRVPPSPASGPVTTGPDGVPLTGTSKQPITNAGGPVMTPPPSSSSPKAGAARASTQAAQQQPMDAMTLSVGAERAQQAVDFQRWKDTQKYMTDLKTAEGVAVAKARAQSKPEPRPVGSMTMSVLDARKITAAGQPLIGYDGEPIDVDTLDPSMGLKAMLVRDPDTQKWEPRYVPFSPNQATVTAGGVTFAVSPMDKSKLPQGAGVELGAAKTPTTGSHEVVAQDAAGNPVAMNLRTSRTPATPGIAGRGQAPVPPTGTPAAGSGAAAAATPTPKASGGSSGTRPLAAMPPAMYKAQVERVTPVRETISQIFGDPTQPKLTSLKDYADLADDPGSRKRMAQALTLTLKEYTAEVERSGGFLTLLQTSAGVPQALAAARAKVQQQAVADLTPREQQAYDAEISGISMMIGLRALSKASAAQFSAMALEREVPLIGINTANSSQFHDKMAHIAEEAYNGTRTIPDIIMPKNEKDFIKGQVGEMTRRRDNAPGAPAAPKPPAGTPSGKKLSPQATEYLRSQGITVP